MTLEDQLRTMIREEVQQGLADGIVHLVGTGVVQVLPLEVDAGAADAV